MVKKNRIWWFHLIKTYKLKNWKHNVLIVRGISNYSLNHLRVQVFWPITNARVLGGSGRTNKNLNSFTSLKGDWKETEKDKWVMKGWAYGLSLQYKGIILALIYTCMVKMFLATLHSATLSERTFYTLDFLAVLSQLFTLYARNRKISSETWVVHTPLGLVFVESGSSDEWRAFWMSQAFTTWTLWLSGFFHQGQVWGHAGYLRLLPTPLNLTDHETNLFSICLIRQEKLIFRFISSSKRLLWL